MTHQITIEPADLDDPQVQQFLRAHLADLAPTAPVESQHALDLDGLRGPGVGAWVAHRDGELVGTVALADLGDGFVELKSMRTLPAARGTGVASALLRYGIAEARAQGATRMALETGSMEFFAPARALYRKHGFEDCPPFGTYDLDPHSVFMSLDL